MTSRPLASHRTAAGCRPRSGQMAEADPRAPAVSGDAHCAAFVLSPPIRNSRQLRENTAFGWIPCAISQVTYVNLAEQGIGFAHPAQNGTHSEPECRIHR